MQSFRSGDRPIDDKNQDMKKALDALTDQDLQHMLSITRCRART
jgi:hypothetical protein